MKKSIQLTATAVLVASLTLAGCSANDPAPAAAAAGEKGHAESAEHEHEHEGEGQVQLDGDQLKAAGIGLAEAGPASIRETLSVYGSIAPNAERVREVAARFPGVIRRIDKKIGDAVREGETLAMVESNESLRTYAVPAPIAGVVTERHANPGEQTGEKRLFTVADLSTVWVELSLFPRDRARVKVGQDVLVRSPDAGISATGRVVYVAPFGSSASQTQSARVQLSNADRKWAPGLYVSAEIVLSQSAAPLTIRNEAIQIMEGQSSVFIEEKAGEFRPVPVKIGRSDGEVSEVLSGVAAGQRYATANSFILKSQLGAASVEHED